MSRWLGPVAKYVLFALFAVCVFDRALASRRETFRLLREQRGIRAQIARARGQNAWRERIRNALKSDPFYVERTLRERYGYRREGEDRAGAIAHGRVQ